MPSAARRIPVQLSYRSEAVLAALCGLLLLAGAAIHRVADDHPAALALHAVALLVGAVAPLAGAVPTVLARRVDVDVLMLLAAFGAAYLGDVGEGAVLMFLFTAAGAMEGFTSSRTRRSIEALKEHLDPVAVRLTAAGSEEVLADVLAVGERILIRPGARVPTDAVVLDGLSSVDESALTGESLPVPKQAGDALRAGSVNLADGALTAEVTRPVFDSTLARMIRLVEEAQERKASTQLFTDWFGERYTWVVIAGTIATFLVTRGIGWPWERALYKAMTLLVVASPCALVLATPAAILAAISTAARLGVLVKGGAQLEAAARTRAIVFDKTGTLTEGRPAVELIVPLNGTTEDEVLRLAAVAERHSEHPVGLALVREAERRGLALSEPSEFRALTGRGVTATVDGRQVLVGNARLFDELGLGTVECPRTGCPDHGTDRCRTLHVGWPEPIGFIDLADTPRPEAAAAVAALHRDGIAAVAMLTGDTRHAAEEIGRAVGIDRVHAELLPEDKLRVLDRLRTELGPVMMVGDGVNDAPALAAADIGVAMGAIGSDVAIETADVILTTDDLSRLPTFLRLCRRAERTVRQNLAVAIGVIVTLVLCVLFTDQIRMPLAVTAHEGSTVLVILNGLRLLRA